jgi:hypothetical protein
MVARTVRQYAKAGVAALHIEDQVPTKRCGHLLGKQVVSRQEFLVRIRAAVLARDSIPGGSDFVNVVLAFFWILDSCMPFQGYHCSDRLCPGFGNGRGNHSTQIGIGCRCRCVLH